MHTHKKVNINYYIKYTILLDVTFARWRRSNVHKEMREFYAHAYLMEMQALGFLDACIIHANSNRRASGAVHNEQPV